MNVARYHSPDEILFMASAMAGDKEFKRIPKGFYISLIQEAFREFSIDSFFSEQRRDLDFPEDTLTLTLPDDCFNMENVYVFNGDVCGIENSRKVYWKRNYYTQGNGYIANDKGNNLNDPFLMNHSSIPQSTDKSLIRYNRETSVNSVLYYNIQMGQIMFSSSCRGAGKKVHLHYRGTGGEISDAPIIPTFAKTAIEDFVIEAALRFRMADEPSMAKTWAYLQQTYARRLDKEGMDGSWFTAKQRAKKLNKSQREELATYLGRGGWAPGR